MRYWASLTAALLAGCALLSPPRHEPAKELLSELPHTTAQGHRHLSNLLVLRPQASPAYDTMRMAYTEKPFQLGYFRDHEWAEPPAEMIQTLLRQSLERTGAFRSVQEPPGGTRPHYVLRTVLQELVQDYTRSPPVLRAEMRAELMGPRGQLIAAHDFMVEQPMQQATPYAGVVAANQAVAKLLQGLAEFVVERAR